ncbi:MAG: hypothetical protein RMJ07_01660 [Nitrososphaerota archaeon]|nr:hypothetical protein [Candidatus Bathyarchaeota archaeon]MDW8048376.1 hypothetical protein [Nitrososphaerota archaeon]
MVKYSSGSGEGSVKRIKANCLLSIGKETVSSDMVDVEVIEEEEGNKTICISLYSGDHEFRRNASIVITTMDMEKILRVVGESYEQRLNRLKRNFVIGTKDGRCPLCYRRETLILIRGGISGCRSCLEALRDLLKEETESIEAAKTSKYSDNGLENWRCKGEYEESE